MSRFILFIIFIGLTLNFASGPKAPQSSQAMYTLNDTIPLQTTEALIAELQGVPVKKTWRDSGYYFQLETVLWRAQRFGTTATGDVTMSTSFSSADPSSLRYRGRAVFQFDPALWPENVDPVRGVRGEALIAFPQDVLLCPSPAQEVGLGQNDPYFPLFLSGQITKIVFNDTLFFTIPAAVQLRDMEIIL